MKAIGPTFADELKAAGLLGLPFSWGADGTIEFRADMPQVQRDAVLAVYAAHNPAALPSTALDNAGAFVSRQRDAALENLDAAIAALPASQQAPLRLIQQLLN